MTTTNKLKAKKKKNNFAPTPREINKVNEK